MSRDIIRAALVAYQRIVGDLPEHNAKEALRLFDEQAVPVDVSGLTNTYGMVPIEEVHALLAGKALVPVGALDSVLHLAGFTVTNTGHDSVLRRDFRQCCDILAASTTASQKEANDGQRSV